MKDVKVLRCAKCSHSAAKAVFHDASMFTIDNTKQRGYKSSCKQFDNTTRRIAESRHLSKERLKLKVDGVEFYIDCDKTWAFETCTNFLKTGAYKSE